MVVSQWLIDSYVEIIFVIIILEFTITELL